MNFTELTINALAQSNLILLRYLSVTVDLVSAPLRSYESISLLPYHTIPYMSCMVADPAEQREKLSALRGEFQVASNKGVHAGDTAQKRIDRFLDSINRRKEHLLDLVNDIEPLMPRFRELSWFINPSEELLVVIKEVIESMEALAAVMVRVYAKLNRELRTIGVGKEELQRYKQLADDLKEVAVDLHDRFFVLPQDDEFQAIMRQLSDLPE